MPATVVLLVDTLPDLASPDLDQRTPLHCASTPGLDRLARHGVLRRLGWDPPQGASDPDTWAALAGVVPPVALARGPLDAAALEVPLEPRDLVFSAPLLTGTPERVDGDLLWISVADLGQVADALASLWSRRFRWMAEPGAAVLRWTDGVGRRTGCADPGAMTGKPLEEHLPSGDGAEDLARLIWDSAEILQGLPLNRRRVDDGLAPLLCVWPWSPGTVLVFPERVPAGWSAVGTEAPWLGLARGLGIRPVPLEPTPDFERAFERRAFAVRERLERGDRVVWVHARLRGGDPDRTLAEIESLDRDLVRDLIDWARKQEERLLWRVAWPGEGGVFVLDSDLLAEPSGRLPFDGRGFAETKSSVSPTKLWTR
jgi:2,3-bisphosphoglycerate-independent phosphoglycerate mutase